MAVSYTHLDVYKRQHMDHTGHLPLLYKQGFRGTVYATEATCDLCGIMLRLSLIHI